MIIRNGVEIKNIIAKIDELSLKVAAMQSSAITRDRLDALMRDVVTGLDAISTRVDRMDKPFVKDKNFQNAMAKFNELKRDVASAKTVIAGHGHIVDYSATEDALAKAGTGMEAQSNYLANPKSLRKWDIGHRVAVPTLLTLALAGSILGGTLVYQGAVKDTNAAYEQLNQVKQENETLNLRVAELLAEIATLKSQLNNTNDPAVIQRLEARIVELETELANTVPKVEYDALKKQLDSDKTEISQLRAKIVELTKLIENAGSSDTTDLQMQLADAIAKLNVANGRITELENAILSKDEKLASMEQRLADIQTLYASVLGENKELKALVQSLQSEVSELKTTNAGLQSAIDFANAEIAKLKKNEAANKDRIAELEGIVATLKQTQKDNEAVIAQQDAKIDSLEQTIIEISAENAILKEDAKYVNDLYFKLLGKDGSGLTVKDKVIDIINYLESLDEVKNRQFLEDLARTIIGPGVDLSSWTGEQLRDFIEDALWENTQPGDDISPDYGNVGGGGSQTPEQPTDPAPTQPEEPVSPDFPVHE